MFAWKVLNEYIEKWQQALQYLKKLKIFLIFF